MPETVPRPHVDEQVPGVPAIDPVATSIAAFVGYTAQGAQNEPVFVNSFEAFAATFGGIDAASDLSYAVSHFFTNGGGEAWIVRVVDANGGAAPTAADLVGSPESKTGIHALDDVDLFNILLVPNQADAGLQAAVIAYVQRRRAFTILDPPSTIVKPQQAVAWLSSNEALRHANAAAYFPRLMCPDPMNGGQLRSFANCGAVAGIYARTDRQKGVWKAPAGLDAVLRGVQALEYAMTDTENGLLNPLGLNALRSRPPVGPVVWGGRTLVGAETLASEWKYVPVRRLSLFIEASLARGLQWAVFEPNDELLWSRVRTAASSFMDALFRRGAFKGANPGDAYFVRCDRSTTTQFDTAAGKFNLLVGFAPLKPAEFVIVQLGLVAAPPPDDTG